MAPQNRKFLAQREKEERQKRIIIGATIAVLLIVIGLVVYGVIDRYVITPKVAVIELEDYSVNAEEFEQQVRWRRRNMIVDIDQILMTFQQLGGTAEVYSYFAQQLTQNVTSLQQPLIVGQEVLQSMMDDAVLIVEAEKMGIVIDDDRIDREIQEAFGYYANGTPTPAITQAPTNTPEAADDQDTPDPTATPLLQPTEYTEEIFNNNYQEFLSSISDSGIREKSIRYVIKMTIIQEEILAVIGEDVDQVAEHVWIRHILVEDEATANEVLEKLADGEDFADLAAEYSLDTSNKDNGGDLDWFTYGMMVEPFEEAAFALEIGEISAPVETDFGFHILESLGKDDLLLDPNAYQGLLNEAYSNWLSEKKAEYRPVVSEDWIKFVPTEPALPAEYLTYIQSLSMQQPELPAEIPTGDDSQDSGSEE